MSDMPDNNLSEFSDIKLPSHAKVVIVGGGIMGCGLAYHLAHEGCTDVVLLEKAELTSGSTWHAAGQITYSTSSHSLLQCIEYNLGLYNGGLEKETGQSVTWHGCGSFRMVYTDDDMDWARQCIGVVGSVGMDIEILDLDAARKIHPFYNYDGVKAVVHTPHDGHADPAGIALALAAGARMRGIPLIRRCQVTGISQLPNGEWRVSTEKGDIDCEHVVNAGGCYARQMGEWNGLTIPTTSMTHHYFVTEQVPEFVGLEREIPVVRDDRMVSGYIRMEQQGGLIGLYEKRNINTVWEKECPWSAENELFAPDYDRILPWLEGALEKMPILGQVGIKRVVHGAISHPPDGEPLIGPVGGARNYWCCCGTQIAIGWGPGLTRELAKWILHGAADISMRNYDPRRFGNYATPDWQVLKGIEDYSYRHELPYPHLNRPAGRPIKKSALYERCAEKDAVFEEIFGHERPRWFARNGVEAVDHYGFGRTCVHDIVAAEVEAVRKRAGVIDISAFAKVMVSGVDAESLIDRLIANRMPRRMGGMTLTHMLNRRGRIELELTVVKMAEDSFFLVCAAFLEQRLLDHIADNRGEADVSVTNYSEQWSAIALQGPRSRDILSQITDAPLDNDNFRWLSGKQITVAKHSVLALRVSYSGELGWEMHGPHEAIAAIYDEMFKVGADLGLVDYGSFAMNSLRLEKAYHGAAELTNEVTLPEAGLWRFARIDKGDFIGRDKTKESMESRDMPWLCVYLEIEPDGAYDGNGGEAVLHNGAVVGCINSIAFGHTTGKIHAFAYVKPEAAVTGTKLEIIINAAPRAGRVMPVAAYDPDHLQTRA